MATVASMDRKLTRGQPEWQCLESLHLKENQPFKSDRKLLQNRLHKQFVKCLDIRLQSTVIW